MTRADIEALGWKVSFDDAGEAVATKGTQKIVAGGGLPLFSIIATVAEVEGKGFAAGWGGDEEVTPALVKAVSGETYTPDPPPPPPPDPPPTDTERVLAVIEKADPNTTDLKTLLTDLQQAIDS